MGVHDLWRLLAPCGHRLSLSVLNRRRLAVDVSIWLAQFVKALPTSQPHLLGLLRRLCKLHYHHILAVCVFDGPAPALKKRTLEQRRRQRERQRESFERVAERLVLEQLKLKSVRDLRRELAKKKKQAEEAAAAADSKQERKEQDENQQQEEAAVTADGSRQTRPAADDSELMQIIDDAEDDPELVLLRQLQEEEDGNSAQDIVARWEQQGSETTASPARAPSSSSSSSASSSARSRARAGRSLTSLTAEEKKLGLSAALSSESEDDAPSPLPVIDPLSYQLPASGELDSSVLASLPISLQYSLLEQHRSHHHSLSMRRYAAVAGDMSRFSALQMGSFLRQVEFNQEIEKKRVEMNAREEMQGMQVRQLPGDRGRQFVYMKREGSRQQEEAKKRKEEQEDETRRRLERWKEREQEGVKYIDAHLSRIKAEEQRHWRCDDCGAHNAEGDSDIADMCQQCGARRKQRQDSGGIIGILLGERQTAQQRLQHAHQPAGEQAKAERQETRRVASFLSSPSSSSSSPGRLVAASSAVYWKCANCSFLNTLHLPRCEICSTDKPDNVQPELVSIDGACETRLSSSGSGKADAIHIMDDDEQQTAVSATAKSTAAAASASIEISFDLNGSMDDDSFPPDFFAAFEEPAAAAASLPSTPAAASASPAASLSGKATSSASAAASLLLPPMTLREAEKIRRPRMRLKKLDVKEIIWFDDDEPDKPPRAHGFSASSLPSAPPARPMPSAPPLPAQPPLRIAEQPELDDEVEEIVVRGTAKLVKKRIEGAKEAEAKTEEREAVSLNSSFLEEEEQEEDELDHQLEGKYDSDDGGGGGDGDKVEVETMDDRDDEGREQLQQAMALSLAAAAAAGEAADEVDEDMVDVQEERRVSAAVGRLTEPERSVLQTIVEDEDEVEEQPERRIIVTATTAPSATQSVDNQKRSTASNYDISGRAGSRSQIVMVEEKTSDTQPLPTVASATVTAHTDPQQEEKEQPPEHEELPASPAAPAIEITEEELVAVVSSSAAAEPPAADGLTADSAAREAAAVASASVATAVAVSAVPDAPRGLLLPSLASLSAPPPKPTNLFFLEQRERAAEQAAQRQEKAAAPTDTQPAKSTSPPASAAATAAVSSSSSASSPSSRPIAVWSSGGDDAGSSGSSFDAHLSSVVTESEQTTSSLSRMKTKQARQQQQVTAEMVDDCRHLLSLFGCPYIVSPAEAEAQCATLELLGLVDGVVTEDSDVFLFGARHVYRNIFEQKKYAERYRVEEVEAVLGLERSGLISLALLLGSDYTAGVHGIGIVNAMEIVNAFPGQGNDGLREFRQWVYSGSVEKRPTLPELKTQQEEQTAEEAAECERHNAALVQAYRKQLFKYKHRNIRTSWHVERDFPSDEVRRGYEQPTVDGSTEPLSWSRPRWDDIIAFLRDKFREEEEDRKRDGSSGQTEAEWIAMVQTLRTSWEEEEERYRRDPSYQQQIDAFFTADDRFAAVRSRRINTAIKGLTRKKEQQLEADDVQQPQTKRKRSRKKKDTAEEGKAAEAEAAAAAEEKQSEPSPAAVRGRLGRGRGRGRAGAGRAGAAAAAAGSPPVRSVAARMREARERRSREDAEWLDDDVVLVEDDDAAGDDEGDWRRTGGRDGRAGERGNIKRGRLTERTASAIHSV